MKEPIAGERWPILLEACVARCTHFHSAIVLRETASTQDAAVRHGASPGTIVAAMRQTAGRGRLGRTWADTASEGIAVTLVVERAAPERLAMVSAVATCRAASQLLEQHEPQQVRIRWPNDVYVAHRKLAGILVEQDDHAARVGVGMNIAQQTFADEISHRACSLAQLGANVDRIHAIVALVECVDAALGATDAALQQAFTERDSLRGRIATFTANQQTVTGTVVEVDPTRGLRVDTPIGQVFLPAQTTSLIAVK